MAGRDTDMRSWADLLHNSSQLLHSYTPSAPLPPIQVHLLFSAVVVTGSGVLSMRHLGVR